MTLFNPIASFFEWILQVYNLLPYALQALILLSLTIPIVLSIFGIFWRIKH